MNGSRTLLRICTAIVFCFLVLISCPQRAWGEDLIWGFGGEDTELWVGIADDTSVENGFDWYAEADISYEDEYYYDVALTTNLLSSEYGNAILNGTQEDMEQDVAELGEDWRLDPGVTYTLEAVSWYCECSTYGEVMYYSLDLSDYYDIQNQGVCDWDLAVQVEFTAGVPSITSISPSSDAVGNSGQITAQGQYLGDPFGGGFTSAAMTGPNGNNQGVTLSGGSSSSDVTSYTVNYSIAQNAAPGTYYLTVTNPFGTSNQATFTVGDSTPVIQGISPSTWPAGATTPVTITGQHFGTNQPKLVFSDPSIGYTLSSYQDTQIQANVTPPASDPGGSVNVSVTSNGYGGFGFTQVPGSSSTSQQTNANVNAIPNVTPTITMNGTQLSSLTSVPVVVGQQIVLAATLPSPQSGIISSQGWGMPTGGTAIAGYVNAAGTGPPDTTGGQVLSATSTTTGSTTFYWVYTAASGQAPSVTFTYQLSNGNPSSTTTVTFNVTGPTGGTMSFTPYSSAVSIADLNGCTDSNGRVWPPGAYLAYGQDLTGTICSVSGTPGITFNSPTGYSNTSGGAFLLVQLISADSTATGGAPGLDTVYPIPGAPPSNDAPIIYLGTAPTTITRNFTANLFLMWKSNSTSSIPVPLGYQTWGFDGSAICSGSCSIVAYWTATTIGTAGPVGGFIQSSASQTSVGNNVLVNGYPTWTSVTR
ncbi:MAG: IPT/TIG domain-containing protein [Terracidiphilus sp.]|jgi:hypothetical protein